MPLCLFIFTKKVKNLLKLNGRREGKVAPQLALLLHSCFDLQTRNRFEGTRSEVESLMKKMKENPHEHKNLSPNTMEGYLYVQEKRRRPGRYGERVWGAVVCWSGGHGS